MFSIDDDTYTLARRLINVVRHAERIHMSDKAHTTIGTYTLPQDADKLMIDLLKNENTITEGGDIK